MASLLHTRKEFESNDEVIAGTEAYFDEKEKSYYKSGIEKLENRYTRCVAFEGNYLLNKEIEFCQNFVFFLLIQRTYWMTVIRFF